MEGLVLGAAFLAAVGLLPARVVARSWGEAVPLAAPVSGLVCSGAAVGALLSGGPLLPWLMASMAVTFTAALGVCYRRRRNHRQSNLRPAEGAAARKPGTLAETGPAGDEPAGPVGLATTGAVALVSAPLLGTALVGPITFDARMIWWFHAAWYWQGGETAAAAMGNAFLNYSHPHYPPLASASVASLWSLVRGGDFWAAQALSAVQTWLALVLVGALAAGVVRGRARPLAGVLGGLLVVAALGLGQGFGLRGYADVTWAAFAVAGSVAGLVLPPGAAHARLAAVCFAAAALTKLEGLVVVGGVVVPLVAARWALAYRGLPPADRGRRLRPLAWVGIAVAAGVAWLPIAHHYTPLPNEAMSRESVTSLLRGESAQLGRIGPALSALWDLTGWLFGAVAVLTLAGGVLLRARRRRLGMGSGGWLLAAAAGAFVSLTAIYAAGAQPLDWWLSTSSERAVTVVQLLLLTEALLWATVALDAVAECVGSLPAPPEHASLNWPCLLVVGGFTAALVNQGGYYGAAKALVAVTLLGALTLALSSRAPTAREMAFPPFLWCGALAAWALARAAMAGDVAAGVPTAAALALLVGVVLVCWTTPDRDGLATAVIAVGVGLATTGWLGVVGRIYPWGLDDGEVWRAATTVTYANAAAGVLVPTGMLAVGQLVENPRAPLRHAALFALIVGSAATLSRGGLIAAIVGVALLARALGVITVARAVTPAAAGALVALVGLAPALPSDAPARPFLAGVALIGGLGLCLAASRKPQITRLFVVLSLPVVGLFIATGLAGTASLRGARLSLASPARVALWRLAARLWADNPIIGTGPAGAELRWTASGGGELASRYAHNEYLQVLAELGAIGLVLLAGLVVALVLAVRRGAGNNRGRSRTSSPDSLRSAGAAALLAFAVGSAFDFHWHVPALTLLAGLLVGITTERPPPRRPQPVSWATNPGGGRPRPTRAVSGETDGWRCPSEWENARFASFSCST